MSHWNVNWTTAYCDCNLEWVSINNFLFNRWTVQIWSTLQRAVQTKILYWYLLSAAVRVVRRGMGCSRLVRIQEWWSGAIDPPHRFDEPKVWRRQFGAKQTISSVPGSDKVRRPRHANQRVSHYTSVRGAMSPRELPPGLSRRDCRL